MRRKDLRSLKFDPPEQGEYREGGTVTVYR
jgi:hypothetical protein